VKSKYGGPVQLLEGLQVPGGYIINEYRVLDAAPGKVLDCITSAMPAQTHLWAFFTLAHTIYSKQHNNFVIDCMHLLHFCCAGELMRRQCLQRCSTTPNVICLLDHLPTRLLQISRDSRVGSSKVEVSYDSPHAINCGADLSCARLEEQTPRITTTTARSLS